MSPEPRAVVFDLDDTLYPYRRFRLSGFAAVAQFLRSNFGIDREAALRVMVRASRGDGAGRELQACIAAFGLPDRLLALLVAMVQEHSPSLRLPTASARVLDSLRRGWRLGVLTNGPDAVQARKVAALRLANRVDTVVYATRYGTGTGKPHPEPFYEVLKRLGVAPARAVFVGDDERCDVAGAQRIGMRTIRLTAWTAGPAGPSNADVVLDSVSGIPRTATALVGGGPIRHAA